MSKETTVEMTEEDVSFEDEFNNLVVEDSEESTEDISEESPEEVAEEIAAIEKDLQEEAVEPIDSDLIKQERDELLQYKRSNEGRVSALQQKINQIQHQRAIPVQTHKPPADITPEKWTEFEGEYPEIAQAMNARMGAMEEQFAHKMEQQVGQAVEPLQHAERQRFFQVQYAALDAAHSDWKEVVQSEPFTNWLSVQPKAVQQMKTSEDAVDASSLISYYKSSQMPAATEAAPQSEAQSEVADIQAKRQQQLQGATNIPARRSSGGNNAIPEDDYDAAFAAYAKQEEMKIAQRR